mgnify:CR=1 FL=1
MKVIRVTTRLTHNVPQVADLFVEVDDITKPIWRPVAAFASLKAAAKWLEAEGYKYVHGTNGIYVHDASTKGTNETADSGLHAGAVRRGDTGAPGKHEQTCGVRRITGKLGRMGATLRPRSRDVARDSKSGSAD